MATRTARQPAVKRARRSAEETRTLLVDAAREAFAELGYADTRVADVVRIAGTSHGTFYTYFKDKRDVLLALTRAAADALYAAVAEPLVDERRPIPENVRSRIAAFVAVYETHFAAVRTWEQAAGVHHEVEQARLAVRDRLVAAVAETIRADAERGWIRAGVGAEIAAAALTAMVESSVMRWFGRGEPVGDEKVDQLTGLWLSALYRRGPGIDDEKEAV